MNASSASIRLLKRATSIFPSWSSWHLICFKNYVVFFYPPEKHHRIEETLDKEYQPYVEEMCWGGRRFWRGAHVSSRSCRSPWMQWSILLMKSSVKKSSTLLLFFFYQHLLCIYSGPGPVLFMRIQWHIRQGYCCQIKKNIYLFVLLSVFISFIVLFMYHTVHSLNVYDSLGFRAFFVIPKRNPLPIAATFYFSLVPLPLALGNH